MAVAVMACALTAAMASSALLPGGAAASASAPGPRLRYGFWVSGPVDGGCPGWGMPYPSFSAAAKLQPSCWNNTLALVTEHAALIDELDLSVGFRVTNVSNGLFDLNAGRRRLRLGAGLPPEVPGLAAALDPRASGGLEALH